MRNLIFCICLALVCSCSLFKKSTKLESRIDSLHQVGKVSIKETVDTSKSRSKEKWKITIPSGMFNQTMLKGLPAFGIKELADATTDMGAKAKILLHGAEISKSSGNISSDLTGNVILEFERDISNQIGKSTKDNQADTSKISVKKDGNVNTKEPINPWLAAGVSAMIIVAIYFFFKK